MYLRFVVAEIDEDSERGLGVIHAAFNLRDSGKLYPYEESRLEELREWFNAHLKTPGRFTAAKPPHYRKRKRAISWFKDSAQEHIRHVHEMVGILERHGIPVKLIKTDRVGYVVYEDEHQVVAEPFSDIPC